MDRNPAIGILATRLNVAKCGCKLTSCICRWCYRQSFHQPPTWGKFWGNCGKQMAVNWNHTLRQCYLILSNLFKVLWNFARAGCEASESRRQERKKPNTMCASDGCVYSGSKGSFQRIWIHCACIMNNSCLACFSLGNPECSSRVLEVLSFTGLQLHRHLCAQTQNVIPMHEEKKWKGIFLMKRDYS